MLDEIERVMAAMGDFNLYDWFIVVVWAISLGYGLVRGFAREALSILGWVSAFLAANVLVERRCALKHSAQIRHLLCVP